MYGRSDAFREEDGHMATSKRNATIGLEVEAVQARVRRHSARPLMRAFSSHGMKRRTTSFTFSLYVMRKTSSDSGITWPSPRVKYAANATNPLNAGPKLCAIIVILLEAVPAFKRSTRAPRHPAALGS